MIVAAANVFAAADPLEEILKEQTKARQEQKAKEQQRQEQIENLNCKPGRGKGWKYKRQKINLHQLDALVVYHLWSDKSLESKKSIKKKVKDLKSKKRLGIRQKEELERLERFLVKKC